MTTKDIWTKKAEDILLNRKIVKIEYMSERESDEMYWDKRPVCMLLDNGVWIFPSQDDEGNDGGALFTTDNNEPCLPVL
tara:strand:+ start:393 stop:629 length:237 start_codon:yes stop_codon:yes gene_type:complete